METCQRVDLLTCVCDATLFVAWKTVQKAKKEKQPKQPKQPKQQTEAQAETKQPEQSSGEFDISAVELRVGKIVSVWNHPDSDKCVSRGPNNCCTSRSTAD